jgi:competence protein ComEA
MSMTADERRALGFVAALLFASAAVRIVTLPEPVGLPGPPLDLAAHVAATERAVTAAERMARPLEPGERLDPNTAPAEELARLPRVGPALARRIVEDREANGPFRSARDLGRVPGVGDRLVELAAPFLDLPEGGVGGAGAGVVDVNRASARELAGVTGIGPVLAERIVAYRDSVGGFASAEELLRVRGIGPATLERIRPQIRAGW